VPRRVGVHAGELREPGFEHLLDRLGARRSSRRISAWNTRAWPPLVAQPCEPVQIARG
jgi:hypothetical protein